MAPIKAAALPFLTIRILVPAVDFLAVSVFAEPLSRKYSSRVAPADTDPVAIAPSTQPNKPADINPSAPPHTAPMIPASHTSESIFWCVL